MERLNTIRTIYEQQKYMYDNRTHSVPDRIISVSPPFVRPIVRKKTESQWSLARSWTSVLWMGRHGWNAAPLIPTMKLGICWRERNGPKNGEVITQAAILADKIYRNCKNLNYCKERGIRLSGPALVFC